ncbi:MAG: hypothetical protein KF768_14375, partial [Phycisphaeraceae bacterium]|nr:hypothetical protein [Phycisphaeraceae bacterium]
WNTPEHQRAVKAVLHRMKYSYYVRDDGVLMISPKLWRDKDMVANVTSKAIAEEDEHVDN